MISVCNPSNLRRNIDIYCLKRRGVNSQEISEKYDICVSLVDRIHAEVRKVIEKDKEETI
jgi:hypothetical protein